LRNRPHRALAGVQVAGPAEQRHHHELAVGLLRHRRRRRRDHVVGDRRQLLGCRIRFGDEPDDHLGGCRQQQHAADDLLEPV
jgi:hypothetical protein